MKYVAKSSIYEEIGTMQNRQCHLVLNVGYSSGSYRNELINFLD